MHIEESGRQTQKRVHIALIQYLAADGLSRPTFEKDVVRNDHGSAAILYQQRFDVLDEIESLIGSRRPEVLTFDNISFLRDLAFLADDRRAAPGTG